MRFFDLDLLLHRPSREASARAPLGNLTSAESLLWTGQTLDPDSPLYNMAWSITIEGPLDVERFLQALNDVVAASDALRATFVVRVGSVPERVVHDDVRIPCEVLDVPEHSVPDDAFRERLVERSRTVLPLDRPLIDTALFRRRQGRWVWFLNQHHLVTDAWSVGVLFRRLSERYDQLGSPSREPFGPFPQFLDYVDHERGLRGGERLADAVCTWLERAPERDTGLRVYGDDRAGTGATRRVRVGLGADRSAAVRDLIARPEFRALTVEQSRFQVFATLMAAWLSRVGGEAGVAFGVPWHNRATTDHRATIGLFVELYPLRVEVATGTTFVELARAVATEASMVLRNVVPGASASAGVRSYSAVLNFITARLGDFAGLPTRADWIHSGSGDPNHKVRVQVHDFDDAGEIVLDFDLDEGCFGEVERAWAVRDFLELFDALLEAPGQAVDAVPLRDWSDERGPATIGEPPARSVPEAFLAGVAAHPDRVAVLADGVAVTYAELDRQAGAVAAHLRAGGTEAGQVVAVCAERSAAFVAALLGVMRAGAAFLALDPAHPDARLRALCEDAGVRILLAGPTFGDRVVGWTREVVDLAGITAAQEGTVPASSDFPAIRASDLAYVLYTSGSTGVPKGVEVEHGSLGHYVSWAGAAYTDGEPTTFAFFTSPAFDLTLTSLFVPLTTGGCIRVYSDREETSGLAVRSVFQDPQVDVAKLTPSHLSLIRDLDLRGTRLRRLILGGESLKTVDAAAVQDARGAPLEIVDEYGPTEATVGCMVHRFDRSKDRAPTVPIGRPAPGMRIHLLDARGRPRARGEVGEITVAGPQVARGYRGRPDETERVFLADPLEPGARMYRTGDLGRWRADGVMEFLGRADDQVKIRGVRIELGEVESRLAALPDVEACVVHVSTADLRERVAHCVACGLEAAHPEAQVDADGVCRVCRTFERQRAQVAAYFRDMPTLQRILDEARQGAQGPHDCIMLYSGGKDSTYALCRIVEMGARPLVFLLDNGFISDQAKRNVRRVVDQLGLELHVATTPAMPEIFADSLRRFSNVCNGCFKAIYTLAMTEAHRRGIRHIVTGLSRGQIFQTRLEDLFRRGVFDADEADRTILEARKAYHRMDDAVSRCLDTTIFDDDRVLEAVQFVDFYRYCDDTLEQMLDYVAEHTPWIRPSDTGRSTNCLINEAGIFVHKTERGFHNYSLPYSWDVRLGHKQRDAALAELDDDLDPVAIREMLDAVRYRERPAPAPETRLVAYYVADRALEASALRAELADHLPTSHIPSAFVRLPALPLTVNGKVDRAALPEPEPERPVLEREWVAPSTGTERTLAGIWAQVLGLGSIGAHDDFFALGGDSIHAIQIVSLAREAGLEFSAHQLFTQSTVARLAAWVGTGSEVSASPPHAPAAASVSDEELEALRREFGE